MFPGMAALERRDRIAVVRNAVRFPVLGVLLLYAYLPLLRADPSRLGPIITAAPGPLAGVIGGIGCFLAVFTYALWPALRPGTRPNAKLADLQFFTTALACVGVFVGLFLAGSDSVYARDPEVVRSIAGHIRLRSVSAWVLCASATVPIVSALVERRRAARV